MLAFFLIVLFVPLMIGAIGAFTSDAIATKEIALISATCLVIAGTSAGIVSCSNTRDIEVWNGSVASKQRERVSCSHSYSCNCRQSCTGSGKSQSCSTTCDTCYEHSYDYDWNVYTTNGETITIDRINRQGTDEPPRFTRVVIGEPTSVQHSYVNYVKAAPGTLFKRQGSAEKWTNLPEYPGKVFDYYRLNRFVSLVELGDHDTWNGALSALNAELGAMKQVNTIVVRVKGLPQEWFYALEEAWVGGKKNDVILVVSIDEANKPQWASVMAWTNNEMFKVKLRDDIMDLNTFNPDQSLTILKSNIESLYTRKPMKDFEYLRSSIVPSTTQWVVSLCGAIAASVGMLLFFRTNPGFLDGYRYGYRGRR